MNSYGVVMNRICRESSLTLREIAVKIGRSVGWLSEVNNKKRFIDRNELERILSVLSENIDRKQFASWAASEAKKAEANEDLFSGAILKHLRQKKDYRQDQVCDALDLSQSYL